MGKKSLLFVMIALLALSCQPAKPTPLPTSPLASPAITPASPTPLPTPTAFPSPLPAPLKGLAISSPAFENGGIIPKRYTCEGENISPPLNWTGVPPEAKSLVLICDDPDAPGGVFNHWLLYNIPPSTSSLPEGIPPLPSLADGSLQGYNSFGRIGYGGPCPPPGPAHRYFFRLYALDTTLNVPPKAKKAQVLKAMEGHILAEAEVMGMFSR